MNLTRRMWMALMAGAAVPAKGETLEAWKPGMLDIHHISTGRGATAFFILPDGTTMLVDAGAQYPTPANEKYATAARPSAARRPGEWIARYIERQLKGWRAVEVDTFLLSHFHSDHMGEVVPGLPKSRKGDYVLTGITDVAEAMPVKRIVDRGYPTYDYPAPLGDATTMNFRKYAQAAEKAGVKVERFRAGAAKQFVLEREAAKYPQFGVRNLAANGEVWTGKGEEAKALFPPVGTLGKELLPSENMCSIAFRMSYGKFDYFGGSDECADTRYGKYPWRDIETPVAEASGPVEVALVNHHGYVDAAGPGWVRALRAQAYVVHGWDSAHPTMPALNNMLSKDLYEGARDIYQTAVKPENAIAMKRLSELKGRDGNVVVRVSPGGEEFQVMMTTNEDESDRLVGEVRRYRCG